MGPHRPRRHSFASGEHRAAMEFLGAQHPRGRRNSLSQAEAIHLSPMLPRTTPANAFSSDDFEALRSTRTGTISAQSLIGMMHPTQERAWDPARGGGRQQIRTGRNFQVPDRNHPGQHFDVRIHTNDNTRADRDENAYSHAVVRVQRSHDHRVLMGGSSHATQRGVAAWVGAHPNDAQANAAHIPVRR